MAQKIAHALVQRGHEVKIQTSGMPHLAWNEMKEDGLSIHRSPSFRKREDTCSVPEMGLYLATNFLPALQLTQKWKPDVLHVHFGVPTGALAWAIHQITKIPYVLTAHLGDVPGGIPEQTQHLFRIVKPFTHPIWQKATQITAVSHFVAKLVQQAYGKLPIVIPNGIPLLSQRKELGVRENLRILFIGRLSIQKNPLLAVDAVAAMARTNWSLKIIGEGPLGQKMRNRVLQLKLEKQISFLGWKREEDVRELLTQSDVLLMPSLQEGLPMAGIEALHHGLAIVGSAIGGLQDVVADSVNGFLCPFSAKEFASRLDSLASSPPLLLSQKQASRLKAQEFEFESSIERYEQVLKNAIAKSL